MWERYSKIVAHDFAASPNALVNEPEVVKSLAVIAANPAVTYEEVSRIAHDSDASVRKLRT